MREELRNRIISLNMTSGQARLALMSISRAIGADDGYYLSDDEFESLLLGYTKED
jgi:hypothetical protein